MRPGSSLRSQRISVSFSLQLLLCINFICSTISCSAGEYYSAVQTSCQQCPQYSNSQAGQTAETPTTCTCIFTQLSARDGDDLVCAGGWPTSWPSSMPSSVPSMLPSSVPSSVPSVLPTSPSSVPSRIPSSWPSSVPSMLPSSVPSRIPSSWPSSVPSMLPSSSPSSVPSSVPS